VLYSCVLLHISILYIEDTYKQLTDRGTRTHTANIHTLARAHTHITRIIISEEGRERERVREIEGRESERVRDRERLIVCVCVWHCACACDDCGWVW